MTEIYNILRRLSLGGKYAGFHFLATAISLSVEDESRLLAVTKNLYPAIAAQYGTSWGCVERNIRTAVSACWKNNRPYLEELAGYALTEKPGPSDFITIVVNHVLRTGVGVG